MRVDLTTYKTESTENAEPFRSRLALAASEHGSAKAGSDQTRIAFDQTRLRALETQALAQPEVRQQRVDLLRQSLGKGEYSVSDTQLADAILADLTSGTAAQPTG